MRNTESVIWGFSGGSTSPELDETQKICEKIWSALNSRVCNVVIVIFVFAEGIVVLSELLVDLEVVQDPEWKIRTMNCSQSVPVLPTDSISPRLRKVKEAFSYCSITLLTIFIIEIILRMVTGKIRFIVQGIEVFDAVVVLVAFGLDLAFFVTPPETGVGKESAVLIILLRFWRITRILQSIITAAKKKLSNTISIYQRDKVQSEHKADLLILKVEDLEHEVAYLKEKLKKTAEKEPLFLKRRKAKETTSLPARIIPYEHFCLPSSLTQTFNEDNQESYQVVKLKDKMTAFAEKAATIIVDEALLLASHIRSPSDLPPTFTASPPKVKPGCKLRRRPDGSMESGYGSAAGSMNFNKSRIINNRTEEEKTLAPTPVIGEILRCPESSPESGYGSGGSARRPNPDGTSPGEAMSSSGSSKAAGTVFLFPESVGKSDPSEVRLEILDEKKEIERIKHIEFDPHKLEKDVPVTSL